MSRIFVSIILSVISLCSSAQKLSSLSGKVVNLKSQPVSGASLRILNSLYSAVADADGLFTIKDIKPGTYGMEITAIGYAAVYQEIAISEKTPEIRIQLTEAARRLDEVIVTAQKREESVQQLPLSVTALSSKEVRDYRLWDSHDITAISPNLYSADPGDGRNVTSVRGITATSYDPAVATYIDGVNQFTLDTYISPLLDIERIEVLRGPQGTLYGRNATGGVINIITRQPSDKLNAFAEVDFGNYNQQRITAGFQIPLLKQKLYLGVSGLYYSRDGYYTNLYNNSSYDQQHHYTGNYYIKYLPGKNWDITYNLKHNNAINYGAFPLVYGVASAISNPFVLDQNAISSMHDNTLNTSLSIVHRGSKMNFSSQTSYQENDRIYHSPIDGDFSPLDGISIINNFGKPWNYVKALTEDLKFNSPANVNGRLKWTAGLYLFYQDAPNKQATRFGQDANQLGVGDSLFTTTATTKAHQYGLAVYGQAVYTITERLDITAGIRFDDVFHYKNVFGQYQHDPMPLPVVSFPDTSASVNYNAFSPMGSVNYRMTSHSAIYFSYSRSFRTGGLTDLSSDPTSPPLYPYKPEYSNNYELGSKNSLLGNSLRLNLAFFYSTITNAQVPTLILPDAITIIKNTGKLVSQGIEAELAALPFKNFEVQYNFGYTSAKYDSYSTSQNGEVVDLHGHHQVFTPNITSMLALQYSYPIKGNQIAAVLRGEWRFLGTTYFDLNNTLEQTPYSIFNSRAGIRIHESELMFWARNIFNKRYVSYGYDFGAVHLGDPVTWGVSFLYKLR